MTNKRASHHLFSNNLKTGIYLTSYKRFSSREHKKPFTENFFRGNKIFQGSLTSKVSKEKTIVNLFINL